MENWRNGELVIDEQNNVSLEINRKYHNNGRPKSSVNIINGVMEGYYREYNDSGAIVLSKIYEKIKSLQKEESLMVMDYNKVHGLIFITMEK